MLEILKFVFSSFWIWLGTFLLVSVISIGIGGATSRLITYRHVERIKEE